ncbi:MAG: putative transrane protein [Verrucomicrobiales bacterium]|nr:putative transrane protein [Verrucomicrobiales bacterium]
MALLSHHPFFLSHMPGRRPGGKRKNLFGHGRFRVAWLALLFVLTPFAESLRSAQYPTEQVKAVFLLNFAQFVDWPANAFQFETSSFIIGFVGDKDDPVLAALEQLVRTEKVKKRPMAVVRFPDARSARNCHILYLAEGPTPSVRTFADLQGRSILTIGETDDILKNGGVIRFITERKISLRINLKAAKSSRLVMSSKLLRLAEVVEY